MKKFIIIISLIFVLFTETAHAASVRIGVIDTGVKEKEGIIDGEKILDGKNYVLGGGTDDEVGHGTRVASLIIGSADGEIVSPCSESAIVPLVYYTKLASGAVLNGGIESICNAIYDAVDIYDCQIINISSGNNGGRRALEKSCGSCRGTRRIDRVGLRQQRRRDVLSRRVRYGYRRGEP